MRRFESSRPSQPMRVSVPDTWVTVYSGDIGNTFGPKGFGLRLPFRTTDLTPDVVAATLDREGIRNRVVIVSACFSRIFVPPLQDDSTIVMTAADANHTSFGCAHENDWTCFGDAFFRQALAPGTDFQNAFSSASASISTGTLKGSPPTPTATREWRPASCPKTS
jgi:hypothetical protein